MNGLNQQRSFKQAQNLELGACVWMEAGVVDYKLCDRDYDCEQCPFDLAFHTQPTRQLRAGKQASGQWTSVHGCKVPRNVFFHPQHTWVQIEDGGVIRIGLDDFGQRMLGRAYSVSLPARGSRLQSGSMGVGVTHQCGRNAVVSPVSGRVRDVNTSLLQRPSLLNQDPFDAGWLMLIEPNDLNGCLKRLMYGDRVSEWLRAEIEKLHSVINGTADPPELTVATMNDGGRLTRDFMGELTSSARKQVIDSFFPPVLDEPAESNMQLSFRNGGDQYGSPICNADDRRLRRHRRHRATQKSKKGTELAQTGGPARSRGGVR